MSEIRKHATGRLKNVSPGLIQANPENPRIIFRQKEMESLLTSIDKYGIQVPLTVYEEGNAYCLIDGERRWRCATKLNLKTVPVLIQDKPGELENLLLMYNIHALREQWDYFTIAIKLQRVIDLFVKEKKYEPNEVELSERTGLSRGQIRRCRYLIDLPDKYKDMLLLELQLPKSQQKISEDLFIEMERSLKSVTKRISSYEPKLDEIRDVLVEKFRDGRINAVTDFRQLSKIATAVDTLGLAQNRAKKQIDRVFDGSSRTGIRQAYERTVEFSYDSKRALRNAEALNDYFDEFLEEKSPNLDSEFREVLLEIKSKINSILASRYD